jgi:hypothetical protein
MDANNSGNAIATARSLTAVPGTPVTSATFG